MKQGRYFLKRWVCLLLVSMSSACVFAGNAEHPDDTHYTASGFFDIHVCNWPNRAPFYMALYSTTQFSNVQSVELMNAQGEKFALLDLSKFRIVRPENKPEKRVFINQVVQPENYTDGWFTAKITLKDGSVHTARDFVEHGVMPLAAGLLPSHRSVVDKPPDTLQWAAVAGAMHYQVFIKDNWDGDGPFFSSVLLNKPELILPEGLLEYGGYYSWRVHARDVNEDIKLGDFNQGSLSDWQEFMVAD